MTFHLFTLVCRIFNLINNNVLLIIDCHNDLICHNIDFSSRTFFYIIIMPWYVMVKADNYYIIILTFIL